MHSGLEKEEQFRPNLGYCLDFIFFPFMVRLLCRFSSSVNIAVKKKLKEEIELNKENKYPSALINSKYGLLNEKSQYVVVVVFSILEAIKRYYESRRRNWRESDSSQQSRVLAQTKKRKQRSRRQRV